MEGYALVKYAGGAFVLVGLVFLLAGMIPIGAIQTPVWGGPPVEFFTAMMILFGGALLRAFYSLSLNQKSETAQMKIMLYASILLLISVPVWGAYLLGVDTGLEFLMGRESIVPNGGTLLIMGTLFLSAAGTALGFSLRGFARVTGIMMMVMGGLALAGFGVQDPSLYFSIPSHEGMAVLAATAFVLLGFFYLILGISPHFSTKVGGSTHASTS